MLNKDAVLKVAQLARLSLNEEQAEGFQNQLDKILSYFDKIAEVDTKGVKPLVTPVEIPAFFREDVVNQPQTVEEILQNAPATQGNLFKVPPVL